MTTKEVARRLVELCRKADFETAQKELYADNVKSVEPMETPEYAKETVGKEAVLEKIKKFNSSVEQLHAIEVSEPLVTPGSFAITMMMDMTSKGKGRAAFSEICVYEVKDGKVVSESFFM